MISHQDLKESALQIIFQYNWKLLKKNDLQFFGCYLWIKLTFSSYEPWKITVLNKWFFVQLKSNVLLVKKIKSDASVSGNVEHMKLIAQFKISQTCTSEKIDLSVVFFLADMRRKNSFSSQYYLEQTNLSWEITPITDFADQAETDLFDGSGEWRRTDQSFSLVCFSSREVLKVFL